MHVSYDDEHDVLFMREGEPGATHAGLSSGTDDVAVELATEDGHDVIGIIAIGASGYLSPWKGYDAERDILTIGETTDDPAFITENGEFVGYWQPYDGDPNDFWDPIGVAIRHASKHLAPVIARLSARQPAG